MQASYTTPDREYLSLRILPATSGRRTSVRSMPRYTEGEARKAVAMSRSYAEALRNLGMKPAGGNHRLFRKWVDEVWQIPTDHFDPDEVRSETLRRRKRVPLAEVMIEHSTYSRSNLKPRLFAEGLKTRCCEACGQGEKWRGGRMALILDHINGIPDDHRLENLRILCPNCAATLATHCGRKNLIPVEPRSCCHCSRDFVPRDHRQRYCSRACGSRWDRERLRGPRPDARKVERPPYEQLMREIAETSYLAVGRKYGVSDNAIRKWVRAYERELDSSS